MQLSGPVHGSPSLQVVPSVTLVGVEQLPVDGLQVPATLHTLPGVGQVTGLLPLQVPFWQVSVCVHRLPSSQLVPSVTGTQLPLAVAHIVQPPHAVFAFCQAPLTHVCGCDPLHVFEPDVQTPPDPPV